jgi:hypothetical protein
VTQLPSLKIVVVVTVVVVVADVVVGGAVVVGGVVVGGVVVGGVVVGADVVRIGDVVAGGSVVAGGAVVNGTVVDATCRCSSSVVSLTKAMVDDGIQVVVVMAGPSRIIRGNDTEGLVGGAVGVGAAVTVWDASV